MRLQQPNKREQSGFSVIEVLLVVLVVVVLVGSGIVVYQRYKSTSAKTSAATNATQPQNTTATQPAQTTTQYLNIKEWGVRLTLNSTTASMYYYMNPQVSDVAYVSLKTISDVAPKCAADKFALGAISRLTETEQQNATANSSSLNQPGTIHIGNYWYSVSNSHAACIDGTAAMNTAVSNAAPNYNPQALLNTLNTLAADPTSKQYLTISEWGVKAPYSGSLKLTYTMSSNSKTATFSSDQLTALSSDCIRKGGSIIRWASTDQVSEGPPDANTPTAAKAFAGANPLTYAHIGNYYYTFAHAQSGCGDINTTAVLQSQTNDAVKFLVPNLQAIPN
jgi:type II secretory pathway pseudopilin PulG